MSGRTTKSNSTYFLALRKRLDSLGYTDLPVGLDSAPLVQQMVEDLITTTETLKETEETLEKQKADNSLLQAQIEPLQEENVRLTRENTQLHQLIIHSKEEIVRQDNQNSMNSFELNAENRRLKLLHQKANEQVKDLEKRLEATNIKLKEALEAPSITNLAELSERESRRTKRSMRSRRAGSGSVSFDSQSVISAQDDTELKAMKEEIDKLKVEVEEDKKEIQLYNAKLSEANDIIKIKDDEIVRIGAELQRETGKNGFIITLRHKFAQQELEIEKLRAQLRVSNVGHTQRVRRYVRTAPKTTIAINLATSEDLRTFSSLSAPNSVSAQKTDDDNDDYVEENQAPKIIPVQQKAEKSESDHEEAASVQSEQSLKEIEKLRSKLAEKKKSIDLLKNEIKNREEIIQQKDQKLCEMAKDIAFIGDNIQSIVQEKDQIIQRLKQQCAENRLQQSNQEQQQLQQMQQQQQQKTKKTKTVIDNSGIELLTKQLEATRADFQQRLNSKKDKIQMLKKQIAQLSKPQEIPPCKECVLLKQQIQELENRIASIQKENEDIESIKANAEQLEKLLQAADEERDLHANDAEKVVQLQANTTILESEVEDLKMELSRRDQKLDKLQKLLAESEAKSNTVPDIQQRARIAVEQAKNEVSALQAELSAKTSAIKELNGKFIECQKLNRKFQQQAQSALEEAATMREEAKFHRSKNEEIQGIATSKIKTIQDEMSVSVFQLKQQLTEKTKEAELLQRLLLKTRAEIAPYTEVQIPQLKEKVAKMSREKQELANRIQSLCELAQFAEKTTEFSPNSAAFIQALHKFQDQVRPFVSD